MLSLQVSGILEELLVPCLELSSRAFLRAVERSRPPKAVDLATLRFDDATRLGCTLSGPRFSVPAGWIDAHGRLACCLCRPTPGRVAVLYRVGQVLPRSPDLRADVEGVTVHPDPRRSELSCDLVDLFYHSTKAMVGTGEALLNVRARGGPAAQANGKGAAATTPAAPEFDFQSELQKFDKVRSGMKAIAA